VRLTARLTRCPFHDRPLPPLRIAEMEEAAGVHPGAVAEVWAAAAPGIPDHYDPDLVDCGRSRCRKRRNLP
jgi:hypothetical protein